MGNSSAKVQTVYNSDAVNNGNDLYTPIKTETELAVERARETEAEALRAAEAEAAEKSRLEQEALRAAEAEAAEKSRLEQEALRAAEAEAAEKARLEAEALRAAEAEAAEKSRLEQEALRAAEAEAAEKSRLEQEALEAAEVAAARAARTEEESRERAEAAAKADETLRSLTQETTDSLTENYQKESNMERIITDEEKFVGTRVSVKWSSRTLRTTWYTGTVTNWDGTDHTVTYDDGDVKQYHNLLRDPVVRYEVISVSAANLDTDVVEPAEVGVGMSASATVDMDGAGVMEPTETTTISVTEAPKTVNINTYFKNDPQNPDFDVVWCYISYFEANTWWFMNDTFAEVVENLYQEYTESGEVSSAYDDGAGNVFCYDFTTMTQSNRTTGTRRAIARLTSDEYRQLKKNYMDFMLKRDKCWVCETSSSIKLYSPEHQLLMDEVYESDSNGTCELRFGSYKYIINFGDMIQLNSTNSKSRPVKLTDINSVSTTVEGSFGVIN